MHPLPHGKDWESEKKSKYPSFNEKEKPTPIPTGINVRAQIVAALTEEYVTHLELVITALKEGKKADAEKWEIWANALKQAIAIAQE